MLSLIPPALTIIIAFLALQVSARQATLAREKLRLDLFDVRFAAWEDINEGVAAQVAYISEFQSDNCIAADLPGLLRVHKAKRRIKLLFGAVMYTRVEELEQLARQCLTERVMMNAVRLHDPIKAAEHYKAYMEYQQELSDRHDALLASLAEFMDFSDYRAETLKQTLLERLRLSVSRAMRAANVSRP